MLKAQRIGVQVRERWILEDVSFSVAPGEFVVVIGANGAGKSTLVHALAGRLVPTTGNIQLHGRDIRDYNVRELATHRGVLTQKRAVAFESSVHEIVALGATCHTCANTAKSATTDAMTELTLHPLADRIYASLSGGECARVDLARVLAQKPDLLFLDEPTNHLDARHQVSILSKCRDLADEGCAVVAVLHDLNLAASFATSVLLMADGRLLAADSPAKVFTPELLQTAFGIPFDVFYRPGTRSLCVLPRFGEESTETDQLPSPTRRRVSAHQKGKVLQ